VSSVKRAATKRNVGAVAAILALGLTMTACDGGGGGATGTGTEGGTAGNGQTTANGGGAVGGGGNEAGGYATGTNIPLPLAATEITWMQNGVEEPQRSFFAQVAADFEAQHPGVTVTIVPVETQELRNNALPQAFDSNDAPDLYQSWGGGQLTDWVNRGYAWDLTEVLAPTIAELNPVELTNWELNGANYGLPYAIGPAGFWVNLNLLNDAGLVQNASTDAQGNVVSGTVDWPTSLDGLKEMWTTLKDHDITPIAVGGGSGWAAPWWYYAIVTQTCSPETITAANEQRDFTDPCWEQAGTTLKGIVNEDVFNEGWETTPDQDGAESSAGLVATGQAAMELQGPWAGTVMAEIYRSESGGTGELPSFIAWYPFPDISGTGVVMAGGDGFSVLDPAMGSQARSDAAAALLAYLLSEPVQQQGMAFDWQGNQVVALPGIPTNRAAADQISGGVFGAQAATLAGATHTIPWLDIYLGDNIGSAMNDAVNSMMRGQISPSSVVTSLNDAAGNL